jgi:hypothetical protein
MEVNMSKPSHIAYVVNKKKPDDTKGFWRPVGAVFQHKDGGFDVVIHDQISVSGRIVCRPPKAEEATEEVEAELPRDLTNLRIWATFEPNGGYHD